MRKPDTLSAAAALVLAVCLCVGGHAHAAGDAPQRIVVFPLFAEEMLLDMIGPERIVYVGHAYDANGAGYSPTMALTEHIPGSDWGTSSDEAILALDPDLIVLSDFLRQDFAERSPALQQAGIPLLFLRQPQSVADIQRTLIQLGEEVGAPEKAAHMAAELQAELASIAETVAAIPAQRRVYVTHFAHSDPDCYRPNNFSVIARAAGVALASGNDTDYMDMNDALLVRWNPDLITVDPYALDTDGSLYEAGDAYVAKTVAHLLDNPDVSTVTAIRNRSVYPLRLSASQYIARSVQDLARLAYPDLFLDADK